MGFALKSIGQSRIYDRIGKELVVNTRKIQSLGWHASVDTHEGLAAMMLGIAPA
jgi:hypothetical protein